MPVTFICQHCGKSVTTSPSRPQEFCSRACRSAHFHVQKVCVICGVTFTQQAARAKEQATCRSPECVRAILTTPEYNPNYGKRERTYSFPCLHCGKACNAFFSDPNRKFCSRACRAAYGHTSITCIICGKVVKTGKTRGAQQATCRSKECKNAIKLGKYNPFYGREHSDETKKKLSKANSKPHTEVECTCGCGEKMEYPPHRLKKNKTDAFFVNVEHMHKWMQGENHWNYRGGNIYYGDGWTKTAKAVRERDKVCQHCGKTPEENGRALDVHHINPARISGDNSLDNLIALCMSCHHKINVFEQYKYPHKRGKYRKCLVCDKVFIPEPFQKICSDECRRKRERQYEKKYRDSHPQYVQKRRQNVKRWQQTNKDRVNELHQLGRRRRKQEQNQEHSA